jgi:hypothetical protein
MAQSNAVVQAILAATSNPQIQAAMLLGSRMESGWSTTAVGDQGTSFGPFQIHLPAHPGVSQAEAENATWAVNYMLPAYTNGVSQVPSTLWSGNPALAAATAAYHAERPLNMYAASAYDSDWTYVQQALGGTSVATGGSTAGGATTAASTTPSTFGPIETDVNTVLNNLYMGGIIVSGTLIFAFGMIFLFKAIATAIPAAVNISGFTPEKTNGNKPNTTPSTGSTRKPSEIIQARATRQSRTTTSSRKSSTTSAVSRTAIGRSFTPTAGRPKPPPVKRIPPKATP